MGGVIIMCFLIVGALLSIAFILSGIDSRLIRIAKVLERRDPGELDGTLIVNAKPRRET